MTDGAKENMTKRRNGVLEQLERLSSWSVENLLFLSCVYRLVPVSRSQNMTLRIKADGLGVVGAALENFPARKRKKSFGSTYAKKKIEAKKRHEEQFVPPPKSVISTFDDGGQYPTKVIILRC